jgi:protein SCO1/2
VIRRRQLFAGLAVPFAHGLVARAQERRKPGADARADVTPSIAPQVSGRELLRRRYFPNVDLTTSRGRTVRFYDDLLKDKIVILNLMDTRSRDVCPTTTAHLKQVRKLLEAEVDHAVFIYSLTSRPEQDSPEALDGFARAHGIDDPRWLFLTGNPAEVDLLRHKLGFADPNPKMDRDRSRPTDLLRYGNEPLAIWGTCQGSAEPAWIAQEIGFAIPSRFKRRARTRG